MPASLPYRFRPSIHPQPDILTMRILFFFAALGFAILGMSGVTFSLLNLIDPSEAGNWPLWQSLGMVAIGAAGFITCLIRVIRGVGEEQPRG